MAADIEAVALVLSSAADAADEMRVFLDHRDAIAFLRQKIGRGEACRAGTNDCDGDRRSRCHDLPHPTRALRTGAICRLLVNELLPSGARSNRCGRKSS